jgi:hypothetical protein
VSGHATDGSYGTHVTYESQPATRVQFGPGAVIQHSRTPSPLFEDEHEHEDDFDVTYESGVRNSMSEIFAVIRRDPA